MTLTKQQALENLASIEAQALELKAFIEQEESKGVWKLTYGDEYFHVSSYGVIERNIWKRDAVDSGRWDIGNAYCTSEEALAAVAKQKALVRINRYIEENFGKWEPDWENKMQSKWFIYYDYSRAVSRFMYHHASDVQRATFIPYLEKESHAEQLIKDMEGDLRIVFGIN